MDQLDLFGLLPTEEAEQYKKEKPKPIGLTAGAVQHAKEKNASTQVTTGMAATNVKPGQAKTVSDKSPEYLNYMKIFCFSAHYILIKNRTLTLQEIRKEMAKRFPELSKERTMMSYIPPKLPKAKKKAKGETEVTPLEEEEKTTVPESQEVMDDADDTQEEEEDPALNEKDSKDNDDTVEDGVVVHVSIPELEDPLISSLDDLEEIEHHLLQAVIKALGPHGMVLADVFGGKKGAVAAHKDMSWVRTHSSWQALLNRPSISNLLQGKDGLYEVRISKVGIFAIKLNDEAYPNAEQVQEGVKLFMPKIPADLIRVVRDFFIKLAIGPSPVEALARIYWDGQRYFAHVPYQVVTIDEVFPTNHSEDLLIEAKYTKVLEMHSHNTWDAFFSEADDIDETVSTGIFGVWGNLDKLDEKGQSFDCRIACGGNLHRINPFDIVGNDSYAPRHLPTDAEKKTWHMRIERSGGEVNVKND